jgi:hypothetical protein
LLREPPQALRVAVGYPLNGAVDGGDESLLQSRVSPGFSLTPWTAMEMIWKRASIFTVTRPAADVLIGSNPSSAKNYIIYCMVFWKVFSFQRGSFIMASLF